MSQHTEDSGTPLTNAVIARLPHLRPQIESFVPDGWDAVAAQALEAIALLSDETGVPISIAQFKEKFGDFRIYVRMDEPSIGPLEIVADTPHYTSLRSSAIPDTRHRQSTRDRDHRRSGRPLLDSVPTVRLTWEKAQHGGMASRSLR